MYLVRLRSILAVTSVSVLTIACGQSNVVSPTAPSSVLGVSGVPPDDASASAGGASELGVRKSDKDKVKGGGGAQPDTTNQGSGGANQEQSSGDRGNGEVSGFVAAVGANSITVNGLTVTITPATVIRHGYRRLTIADIQTGDHVQVRGTITGTTLAATEIKVENTGDEDDGDADDDDANEVKVTGAIAGIGGSCPARTFTVGTTRVTTSAATRFDGTTCAALANGVIVEVKGIRQADGSVLATKVELESTDEELDGRLSALTGTCPAVSFTVRNTRVTTSAATVFTGVTCLTLVDRMKLEVEGTRQADGSIAATSVEAD